jgi:hypothetical protein
MFTNGLDRDGDGKHNLGFCFFNFVRFDQRPLQFNRGLHRQQTARPPVVVRCGHQTTLQVNQIKTKSKN